MAANKTQPTDADVGEYLSTLPETQAADARELVAMMTEATGAEPVLWGPSIVGFGSIHMVYESGRELDWFEVGFAPRKGKMVLYIMPGFSAYEGLLGKLGKHKTGKSCLYVNKLADVDRSVLSDLVGESVRAMRAKHG